MHKHDFLCERATVLNHAQNFRHKFHQIIGEHAVRMVDLALSDRNLTKTGCNVSKKSLMKTWSDLVKLNDEWVGLLCGDEMTDPLFHETTQKLVHLYTEALGDYVIDRHTCTKKLEDIAKLEGQFYGALSKHNSETTMQHWNQYTGMIVAMIRALDKTHAEDPQFLINATKCIRAGRLLGMWLDASL